MKLLGNNAQQCIDEIGSFDNALPQVDWAGWVTPSMYASIVEYLDGILQTEMRAHYQMIDTLFGLFLISPSLFPDFAANKEVAMWLNVSIHQQSFGSPTILAWFAALKYLYGMENTELGLTDEIITKGIENMKVLLAYNQLDVDTIVDIMKIATSIQMLAPEQNVAQYFTEKNKQEIHKCGELGFINWRQRVVAVAGVRILWPEYPIDLVKLGMHDPSRIFAVPWSSSMDKAIVLGWLRLIWADAVDFSSNEIEIIDKRKSQTTSLPNLNQIST